MQSSSEEKQHDEDGGEETDPLPAQDLLALQSDDLDPQSDPDLSMAAPTSHLSSPNTSDVSSDPESPEEEELLVLDSEHPLAKRFQDALNTQLRKKLERIKQELNEKCAVKKADDLQLETVVSESLNVQGNLTKMKHKMENVRQAGVNAEVRRRQAQDQLEATRSKFSDLSKQHSHEETEGTKLQGELEKMLQHLSFTQGVSEDLRSKVKTMKNVQHRAGAEKTQAEDQKLQKDLYVAHLTKHLGRLTQQVDMYDVQKTAQAEETKAAKEAFSEAEMEMESLVLARKQLLQQWNSILTSIRRKNEALCAMQEAVRSVESQVILLERDNEGYKKATAAEQEKNETLTVQLNWWETNCATSKRRISQKRAEQEALQAEYSACLLSLQESERTVSSLTEENNTYQSELNEQRVKLEKEKSVRLELEDQIMSNIQQQLTHSKAAQNSQQLISKLAALRKDKMCQLQQLENDTSSVELEIQKISEHLISLAPTQEALNEETDKYNTLLNSNQTTFSTFARLIDQKQATIVSLTTKISNIAASTGRDDLGPFHIKVQGAMAQIEQLKANISKGEQLWMLQQGTLVGLSKDLESKSRMMLKLQTQHTAMKQKKIHLQSQLEQEERDNAELEKNSKILERDLEKLSVLLSKNQHLSRVLDQENSLMERDFIQQIKESEWESVSIQLKVEKMQEEKEMLLQSLMEAEKQIMLWERKTQILKETRSFVDSQIDKEEIQKMKAEIHRMELRVNQLTKQQNQLMRDSEAAVARRESILLRKEAMARSPHKEKALAELKRLNETRVRKIKRSKLEVANREKVIMELETMKDGLSSQIVLQTQQLTEQSCTCKHLDSDLDNLQDNKDAKQACLIALQSRSRKLRDVCEGRYRLSSSSETVGGAQQTQRERLEAVGAVLRRAWEELPHHQGALHKLSRALKAYVSLETGEAEGDK